MVIGRIGKDMGYKNASDIFIAEYDKGQLHIVEY